MPVLSIAAIASRPGSLVILLEILLVMSLTDSVCGEGGTATHFICTTDADCQYPGCNDKPCGGSPDWGQNCNGGCNCRNRIWDAICLAQPDRATGTGSCWTDWWTGHCPEPPIGWGPTTTNEARSTTAEPTTTTEPTTTPEPTFSAPELGCEPVEKIVYINKTIEVEKIIYKSWQENPGRKDWGRPGHSHCVQPYTWGELVDGYKDNYIPYKVGGLGQLLETGGYETWICLLNDHPCGDPHYCWVYHETDKVFTAWGTNTELGLHFK